MKKIKVGVSIGLSGCKIEDEIEVEDDLSLEEIEVTAREWAMDRLDWWFEETEVTAK